MAGNRVASALLDAVFPAANDGCKAPRALLLNLAQGVLIERVVCRGRSVDHAVCATNPINAAVLESVEERAMRLADDARPQLGLWRMSRQCFRQDARAQGRLSDDLLPANRSQPEPMRALLALEIRGGGVVFDGEVVAHANTGGMAMREFSRMRCNSEAIICLSSPVSSQRNQTRSPSRLN